MAANAHEFALEAASAGDLTLAEKVLRFLLGQRPDDADIRANLGTVLLAQGRYADGVPLFEARLQASGSAPAPALPCPRWAGEDLAGQRVLVWPEQGLGDQIMFARFVAGLSAKGCETTLVCAPPLARLFAASLPATVLPAAGRIDFPDPDVWLWSGSLLAASGAELSTLPRAPYLRPPEAGPAVGRLGVAARGSPTHKNDADRSLPQAAARRLAALPGAISLLPEDTRTRDMAETAALIAGLERVICVDTSVAHLAAAMGKPTWILLPAHGTDWRWLSGRSDSPWYPSVRLFRQPARGDWDAVLDAVETALGEG